MALHLLPIMVWICLLLCLNRSFAFIQKPLFVQIRRTDSPVSKIGYDASTFRLPVPRLAARGGISKQSTATKKNGMAPKTSKNSEKSTPFNVNASLSRLEKKYDELTKANAKSLQKKGDSDDDDDEAAVTTDNDAIATTEYVVAARADGHVADWVPIAQLCLARPTSLAAASDGVADPLIQASVSHYCRELSHVATIGSRVFQSVPRNMLQYAVETLDSFHKHVYEPAVQGKNDDTNNDNVMTKQEARMELNLFNGDGEDKSAIKRSYRILSFEWHPDRFVGADRNEQEIAAAAERYARIKLAYDTLNSGVRDEGKSWYQSLGGKARTDFVGPLKLLPLDEAKQILETSAAATAISGMSPNIVQSFVARSQQ